MSIKQLQASYIPIEDRVLMRMSTTDNDEFQLLLTRRFVKNLLAVIVKILELDPDISANVEPEHKKAVLGFAQQEAMQKVQTDKPYQKPKPKPQQEQPLGDKPTLATNFHITPNKQKGAKCSIETAKGKAINMQLAQEMLHIVYKLLDQTAQKAEWNLPRQIDDTSVAPSTAKH